MRRYCLYIVVLFLTAACGSTVKVRSSETRIFHKECPFVNDLDESNMSYVKDDADRKVKMFKEKVAPLICTDESFNVYNDSLLIIMSDLSENPTLNTEFYTGFYKDKVFNFIYNLTADKIEEFEEWEPNLHYYSEFVDHLMDRNYSEIEKGLQADSCDSGMVSSGAYYYQVFSIDYFDKDGVNFDVLVVDLARRVTNIYHYRTEN